MLCRLCLLARGRASVALRPQAEPGDESFVKTPPLNRSRRCPAGRQQFATWGVGVALFQYTGRSGGVGSRSAEEWVLGNEDDLEATEFRVAKGRRELLAFTHDHIFSLAMLLFVVLHLVQLTPLSSRSKVALTLVGFGGLGGTLGIPWWIAGSGGGAPWLILSGTALLASLTLGSIVCLAEMWVLPGWRRRRGRPAPPPADPMFPPRAGADDRRD